MAYSEKFHGFGISVSIFMPKYGRICYYIIFAKGKLFSWSFQGSGETSAMEKEERKSSIDFFWRGHRKRIRHTHTEKSSGFSKLSLYYTIYYVLLNLHMNRPITTANQLPKSVLKSLRYHTK